MARRAPAVERSIAVLNHLAADPSRKFTLSEIAREVGLNKATLHAILGALSEAGYLTRDEDEKLYGLGPALIALGNSALVASPAADCAKPEMQSLTDDLGLDCVASAAIHDEIVIMERAGTPRPFGINVQPGQRLPLRPPLGTVFVAWSGPAAIDRYLGKLGDDVAKATRDRYRRAIDVVRERGYSVGLEASAKRPAKPTLEEGVRSVRMEEYALLDLDDKESYRLSHVGAPVFGPHGEVVLAMFLIGFGGPVTGAQLVRYADRLTAAAARVTKSVHGRPPLR